MGSLKAGETVLVLGGHLSSYDTVGGDVLVFSKKTFFLTNGRPFMLYIYESDSATEYGICGKYGVS